MQSNGAVVGLAENECCLPKGSLDWKRSRAELGEPYLSLLMSVSLSWRASGRAAFIKKQHDRPKPLRARKRTCTASLKVQKPRQRLREPYASYSSDLWDSRNLLRQKVQGRRWSVITGRATCSVRRSLLGGHCDRRPPRRHGRCDH